MAKGHTWKFFRAGGVDQVILSTADDLRNLESLDQKLWVALACPSKGLEHDARTLTLLDSDNDGRIRPPEILAAIAWLDDALRDLAELFRPSDELPLASISNETETGKEMLAAAKLILDSLGKGDAKAISLADVSDTEKIFIETKLNGDGIVPAESADDDDTKHAVEDVMSVLGSRPDRSKKPGVDQAKSDLFFDQVKVHADWLDAGRGDATKTLGDASAGATEALEAVRSKVDDYFARCRLAAFDPRGAAALNASDDELKALGTLTLNAQSDDVARLPLARVESGRPLPLGDAANPAWVSRLAAFAKATVVPAFGGTRTSLTEADWTSLKERVAPFVAWLAKKPATEVAKLGDDRVMALARGDVRAKLNDLISRDAALATQSNQIESVEKLIRFRKNLVPLLENFVNFAKFYGRRGAVFQAGTLYIDARSCNLVLPVEDVGRHALLATNSQAYLLYCDCVRKGDLGKRTIVAAVTGGDVENLMVGRNGVFYDRDGVDWDATITKIVENPISIRQAFWLPYKRVIRMVEQQFAKRAKAADDEGNKKLETAAVDTANVASSVDDKDKPKDAVAPPAAAGAPAAAAPPPDPPKGIDIGTVAAIGVAVGGIATFFSSILATFLGLGMWMPIGLVVLLLGISGPSMLIAWLKLRQRNIGPILDANGWAVNAMARVNVPFGGALTDLATLPEGASRSLDDPFAEKKRPWKLYVFLIIVLLVGVSWALGKLDEYLPEKARAATVLRIPPKSAALAPPSGSAK
jgi:hypothetical protein